MKHTRLSLVLVLAAALGGPYCDSPRTNRDDEAFGRPRLVEEAPGAVSRVRFETNVEDESAPSNDEALLSETHKRLKEMLRLKTEDEQGAQRSLGELLALLNEKNLETVVRSLSREEFLSPFGSRALELWLETDGEAAASWLAGRPEAGEEHAHLLVRRFLFEPSKLAAYCDGPISALWRAELLGAAGREYADSRPLTALSFAGRVTDEADRAELIETIAYSWFSSDPEQALRWVTSVGNEALRQRLLAVGSKALASDDPELAAGLFATTVKPGELQKETALSLVELWAERDPRKTAQWVNRFEPSELRRTAASLLAERWQRSDRSAAEAWLRTLPEGGKPLAQTGDAPSGP